ncbi:MAG TPA: DUF6404 family protein, partial [Polyangiaceae bacterium]|nr:DUF6404 family protein [Polyangiaceae bacterium]
MPGKGVEGVAEAVDYLVRRGVWRSTAAPPLFRVLWWLRVSIPPPHFMRPSRLFALAGVWFGVAWGGLMWLLAPGIFGIGT